MTRAALIIALGLGLAACATPKGEVPPVITPPPPPPMAEPETATETEPEPVEAETMAEPNVAEYDESWSINDYWSGEWPDGFTVTSDNVVLMGRAAPHPSLTADIACPLAKNTNVNPWNHARGEADNWEFMSANKRTKITMLEDAAFETGFSEKPSILNVKAGDVLTYESYIAEGFFIAGFEGETYELNEGDFNGRADFEQGGETHEWVNVECGFGKGTRAWLLLSEVQSEDGIGPVSFDAFGSASDLDKGPNNIEM